MTDKKPVPPALAQFALEQLAEAGEQAAIDLTVQNVEILRAEIVKRDARIAELEATKLHGEMVMLRTDRDRLAAELKYTIAALKAQQPSGAVLPEHFEMEPFQTVDKGSTNYKAGFNAAIRKVRESLNPCRAQPVPDGYVVVPVEPTPEMSEAAATAESSSLIYGFRINRMYAAMLAAAPSAQQKESGDE